VANIGGEALAWPLLVPTLQIQS